MAARSTPRGRARPETAMSSGLLLPCCVLAMLQVRSDVVDTARIVPLHTFRYGQMTRSDKLCRNTGNEIEMQLLSNAGQTSDRIGAQILVAHRRTLVGRQPGDMRHVVLEAFDETRQQQPRHRIQTERRDEQLPAQ